MRYRGKIKRKSQKSTILHILGIIIKTTANQVDRATERRIQRAITQGGKEVKRIAQKIIRQEIEELNKTPFYLFVY